MVALNIANLENRVESRNEVQNSCDLIPACRFARHCFQSLYNTEKYREAHGWQSSEVAF